MNVKKLAFLAVVLAVVSVAEASTLKKKSLLSPIREEPCFTCKTRDRPFAWPIISYIGKFKDALVRKINTLTDKFNVKKLI